MLDSKYIFPVFTATLSAYALYLISLFDEPRFQDATVNAKFFPTTVSIIIIMLSLAIFFQEYRKRSEPAERTVIFSKKAMYGLLFVVSYITLIYFVGYLFASFISFYAYLLCLRVKKIIYYIVATVFVITINYLFGSVFYIALPQGLFY